jgi:predicted DNA repair protein MutK
MPKILKSLGWIGAIAMLMVGGSIIIHNHTQQMLISSQLEPIHLLE